MFEAEMFDDFDTQVQCEEVYDMAFEDPTVAHVCGVGGIHFGHCQACKDVFGDKY